MNRQLTSGEKARAVREGAARAGISLLELGNNTGHSASNLELGHCNFWNITDVLGFTDEQMYEFGHA